MNAAICTNIEVLGIKAQKILAVTKFLGPEILTAIAANNWHQ